MFVLTIEESAELNISGDLVRRCCADGDFGVEALLRAGAKLKPARIVVGEIHKDFADTAIETIENGTPVAATIQAHSSESAWIRMMELSGMQHDRVQNAYPVVAVMDSGEDGVPYIKSLVGA